MAAQRPPLRLTLLLLLLGLLAAGPAPAQAASKKKKNVSDYFKLCKRHDPELNACVQRSIEEAKPRLVKGIPELRLPPMDPLHILQMQFQEGEGIYRFRVVLSNITISGLGNFTIQSCKMDLAKGTNQIDMVTPRITMEGLYEMEGRILSLPIKGNGDCTLDFWGVRTQARVQIKNETRGGLTYGSVQSFLWDIEVQQSRTHFSNLFNGDARLGDAANTFFNQNWRQAFEASKHVSEEAFAQYFTEVYNRFFDQFPLEELYPE